MKPTTTTAPHESRGGSENNRKQIIEMANSNGFSLATISYPSRQKIRVPAKLQGHNLRYPQVVTDYGHTAEISWHLAERIAKGEVKTVL